MTAPTRVAAIDFGASNTDVVVQEGNAQGTATQHWRLPSEGQPSDARVHAVLAQGGVAVRDLAWIAVTGGNRSALSATLVDGASTVPLHRVDEVQAIGRGGLALSGLARALVTSAGSGTAVVAATAEGARHVSGTGVGGGTLVGLSRLLIDVVDPQAIDALAQQGRDTVHNLTIGEILGTAIGSLPPDTTAVNFGRAARHAVDASPADTAAALVNMVGQVIGVVAVNAARAQQMEQAVIVGHLTDLPSIRRTLETVAQFYHAQIVIPEEGGRATALGALLETRARLG
ncbi:MAG: Fumble domain-containing protein [Gemmatimonadetes bacterium]|nr:Fumble domain-containing protein [Gemmatimonadota bacterium]